MDVLLVEPEKSPRMITIKGDLESLQQAVGGLIEAVYPYDDPVAFICNEEGKLMGLPLNRRLEDFDIIAGNFMICGLGEEDFDSLPPHLAEKYREKFACPEIFLRVGSRILAVPMEPPDDQKEVRSSQRPAGPAL